MRAAKELGVKTVAVYSTEDADTYPGALCGRGGVHWARPGTPELPCHCPVIIAAAQYHRRGQAVHPGYGFLAENAAFARACADNDLVFIGPSPDVHRAHGRQEHGPRDHEGLRRADACPAPDGCMDTASEEAKAFADTVGYPVLIKATAGGGGKGMREVHDPTDLESQYQARAHRGGRCIWQRRRVPGEACAAPASCGGAGAR